MATNLAKAPKKAKTLSQWKKELDKWFSLFIRYKYSEEGMCECYTCGKRLPIKSVQCGHFVPRSYLATRFEVDNCRPQCVGCNMFGNGKILEFEEHLIKDLGKKRVEEVKAMRHKITKLTPAWYEQQIADYRQKVNLKIIMLTPEIR